jgi:hypothetical protein
MTEQKITYGVKADKSISPVPREGQVEMPVPHGA